MQLDATQAIPMSMSEYFVAQYVLPWQCRRLCRCPLPSSVAVVAGAAAAAAAAESCVRTVRVSAFRAGAAAAVGAPTRQLDAPSLPATRSHCTSLSPAEDSPIIPPANAQMTPKAARGGRGGIWQSSKGGVIRRGGCTGKSAPRMGRVAACSGPGPGQPHAHCPGLRDDMRRIVPPVRVWVYLILTCRAAAGVAARGWPTVGRVVPAKHRTASSRSPGGSGLVWARPGGPGAVSGPRRGGRQSRCRG